MNHLIPCPGCSRHVRAFESECPFCRVDLDLSSVPEHAMPTRRLGRAALFTFGATLAAGLAGVGCGSSDDGGGGSGGGTSGSGGSGGTAGSVSDATFGGMGGALYGLAADSGLDGASGNAGAAGSDANTAGAYGLPPDAGS